MKFWSTSVKFVVCLILSILTGCLVGFFGVLVSVFADGGMTERFLTIGAILLIYFILSGIFAFLIPFHYWRWSLFVGVPGVFLLGFYMFREYNLYYIIYMILILFFAFLGSWVGSTIKLKLNRDRSD